MLSVLARIRSLKLSRVFVVYRFAQDLLPGLICQMTWGFAAEFKMHQFRATIRPAFFQTLESLAATSAVHTVTPHSPSARLPCIILKEKQKNLVDTLVGQY